MLANKDRVVGEILRMFDSQATQIHMNIQKVYTVMIGVKAYRRLLSSTHMQIIDEGFHNHCYVRDRGIMDEILASSPFIQALIDKQMNTDYEPVSRDVTSPSRDKSTDLARQKSVNARDCNLLPPGISILHIDKPCEPPIKAGAIREEFVTHQPAADRADNRDT